MKQNTAPTSAPPFKTASQREPESSHEMPARISAQDNCKPQSIVVSKQLTTVSTDKMFNKWNNNQGQPTLMAVSKKPENNQPSANHQKSVYNSNTNVITSDRNEVKTINFEENFPHVVAHSNENFSKLNKSLNKNQPPTESRKQLVNNPYLADVRFLLGNKELYAHKIFLVTSSSLFYKTFEAESQMRIESISEEIFLMLLTYCYTNQLKLTSENVLEILDASSKLEIRQASNICHGFISNMINNESVFDIFDKAIELHSDMFQKKCLDYIAANEVKCFNSKGFYKISITSLQAILTKCNYDSSRSSEIIEKWTHGALNSAVQTGAKKKPTQNHQNQNVRKIPSLVDMVIPSPPLPEGLDLGHNLDVDLINFNDEDTMSVITCDDDDEEDNNEIICVDDDTEKSQVTVTIKGSRRTMETNFSRIDFVAKQTFLLHSIWFNENLFVGSKEVRVTISVFEQNKRSDIHNRVIKNTKPGDFCYLILIKCKSEL
jgi:hypothetical protein